MPLRNRTELQLPFEGRWLCFWGGTTPQLNWHHNSRSQRYAYDFAVAKDDVTPAALIRDRSKLYRGAVPLNENSFSFRKAILAPAAGLVVMTRGHLPDIKPTYALTRSPNTLGNYIMLMHREDEFSVLGHLRKSSLLVQPGDDVKPGQKIAECGNSGASTDAHLHFHMQNSPQLADIDDSSEWVNDTANSIQAGFVQTVVIRSGRRLRAQARHYPKSGDFVEPLRVG